VPDGETEFQFKAADINFHSSVYDAGSLVISAGRKATYRGGGTVNGQSGYRFVLIAYDGDQPGGDGIDRFRIKITQGGAVIYDNRPGVSEDVDLAEPTALGGGSIVIHTYRQKRGLPGAVEGSARRCSGAVRKDGARFLFSHGEAAGHRFGAPGCVVS